MESKQNKYHRLRPILGACGLFLTRKNKLVSKLIRHCDNGAEFSHVGIYFDFEDCYFAMDANANGVAPELLSKRIKECQDFCFIKPVTIHVESLKNSIRSADKGIRYDFINGGKELFNRKFGTKLNIIRSNSMDICSDYVSEFAQLNFMVTKEFNNLRLPFPQDYIRFNNEQSTQILR